MHQKRIYTHINATVSGELPDDISSHGPSLTELDFCGLKCPRPMEKKVSSNGRMANGGYQPENSDWDPFLTELVDGHRAGLNPMEIDPEILKKAGHGPRRTRAIAAAVPMPVYEDDNIHKHSDIRQLCRECSSCNLAEIRGCSHIDCAAWPYRMGKNPHNPRRGKNPFPEKSQTNRPTSKNESVKPEKGPVSGDSICEMDEDDTSYQSPSFENSNAPDRQSYEYEGEEQ
jgi:hypothetical protein